MDSHSGGVTLYPSLGALRAKTLLVVVVGAVVLLAALGLILDAKWWSIVLGLGLGFGILVYLADTLRSHLRVLGTPKPLVRVDERGIECAQGWVGWSDVERIRFDGHEDDGAFSHLDLILTLRPDAAAPVGAAGYSAEGVTFDPPELTVPLWGVREKKARESLREFYAGEIAK